MDRLTIHTIQDDEEKESTGSASQASASAGMRSIGTLVSPVFIIESTFGLGNPARCAISRYVRPECSMAVVRKAAVGLLVMSCSSALFHSLLI
ncbi:hypothetical protein [Aliiruegeria lutimaris]|uniref:hypothetical protein n=1 Tax=Aliiruegeria lutimaris TaxID=571298 RepID=UPI0011132EBF|nr:hypothetical protein [Aliiruegeria lutimaris]